MGIFGSGLKSLKVILVVCSALFSLAVFAQVGPPSGITATGRCAVVDLAWQPVSGATSYYIYRSTEQNGDYGYAGDSQGLTFRDGTSPTRGSLDYSTVYYYKITSDDGSGEGAPSSAVSATTQAPTNWLTAAPAGASIKVKWGTVSGPASLYRIGQHGLAYEIASFTTTPTSYLDRNPPQFPKSYYRLYSDAKGWETGPTSEAGGANPDILPGPFDIDPDPSNGVLPNALILPGWMAQTMPFDSSNAPSGGPSSAIAIDLAHGVASAGAPGVTALNPNGSDFGFSLQYRTALAAGNVASPGLPVGWAHNWDIRIIQDGEQPDWEKSFRLVYPSGASEVLTPDLDSNGNPLDTFTVPDGAPYIVTGVHATGSNSTGKWDSLTISGNGEAKQVFTKAVGDAFYRLSSQVDSNGTSTLYFTYSSGKLTQIFNGLSGSFAAGIVISYNSSGGTISQALTYIGTVNPNFVRNYTVASGNLTQASKLNLSAFEWKYGYQAMNGKPYLTSVESLTPAGGGASAIAYVGYDPDSGRASSVTDALTNTRFYNYTVSEDGGETITGGARTTTIKDGSGNTFDAGVVICDELGRETASKDRLGATTTVTYGDSNDPSAVTQVQPPMGSASLAEYDSHGNLTKATAPYGNYTRYTWEYPTEAPLGRIIKVQEFGNDGQNGNDGTPKLPTTYTYYQNEQNYVNDPTHSGPKGYLKKITFPKSGSLNYYYAVNGNVLGVSGVENYTYGYLLPNNMTLVGRPTSVTHALTGATTFGYDANLRLNAVTDSLGTVSVDYNEYGQVKKAYLPGSKSIDIAFGVNGRAAHDATLNTSQGNLTLFTNTYNSESVLATSKNSLNVTETQSPNPALGLSSVTNGASQPMHLYTPDTNLRTVDYRIGTGSNAVGIKTTFNAMGNAISTKQTLPSTADIGSSSYRGDDPDMLDSSLSSNSSTFAANFNTSYTYDKFGRIWTATSEGTGTSSVSTATPYVVTHTYTYDDEDHVLTDNNITYTYNTNGTLNTMTVSNLLGSYVRYTYSYDSKLRTTQIAATKVDSQGNFQANLTSASYIYDNADRVTHVWTAHGVTKYVYDSESRITALYNLRSDSNAPSQYQISVELPNGGGTTTRAVLSSFTSITHDKLNNRTGVSIALATTTGTPTVYKTGAATFGYDDAGRLTSESWSGDIVGNTTVSYTHGYDNADNLTTLRSGGLTFDAASDLLITSGYTFNTFGDAKTWANIALDNSSAPLDATDGWDPVGQLTRVSGPTAVTNSFGSTVTQQMAYDDQGRRAWSQVYGYKLFSTQTAPTYTDSYTYSGSDLIMRKSMGTQTFGFQGTFTVGNDFSTIAAGSSTIFYLVGPTGAVIEFDINGAKADLTYDPQGSIVASYKGSLSTSPWMLYDAYGKPVAKRPGMTNDEASRLALNQPLQYKGQFGYIADGHTGAYYCMHRFYDPNTGRWLSRDPAGLEGGTNTFAYCNGNPVMRVDPSGLDGWWWDGFTGVLQGYWNVGVNVVSGSVKSGPIAQMYYWSLDMKDLSNHGWSSSYQWEKGVARNKAMMDGLQNGVARFFGGFSGDDPVAFGESWGNASLIAFQVASGSAVSEATTLLNASRAAHVPGEMLTVAGRALSKHPDLAGFSKPLNQFLPSTAAQNAMGESLVQYFIKNGVRSVGKGVGKDGQPFIQYTVPGKGAVRFNSATKKFIGFRKA